MARTRLPIETDAGTLAELGRGVLRAAFPGIQFPPAGLLTALTAAGAEMSAYARDALSEHDDEIYERLATTVLGYQYEPALRAIAAATWTLTDDDGLTIEAGTQITVRGLTGQRVGFETVDEITIPAGQTATATGAVTLRAIVAGTGGNGLQADPQPENALARLAGITFTAPSSGGADAEDLDAFLARVREEQQVALPGRLVIASDAEILARRVAGVDRALVLDTYDPSDGETGHAGHMTIAAIDAIGEKATGPVKTALLAYLVARCISGVQIHVIDPTYTTITPVYVAVAHAGYDPDVVKADADAAVTALLSPANHGLPYGGDERRWINRPVIRYRDYVAAIEDVEGLDYTSSAPTLNAGTTNITLTGAAPLPRCGTISGTVTAP